MKKIFRKVIAILIATALIFSCTAASSGLSANLDTNNEVWRFQQYISNFFENPNNWRVIDVNGEDISDQYYEDYLPLYQNKDFLRLMQLSDGIVDSLCNSDSV